MFSNCACCRVLVLTLIGAQVMRRTKNDKSNDTTSPSHQYTTWKDRTEARGSNICTACIVRPTSGHLKMCGPLQPSSRPGCLCVVDGVRNHQYICISRFVFPLSLPPKGVIYSTLTENIITVLIMILTSNGAYIPGQSGRCVLDWYGCARASEIGSSSSSCDFANS